MKSFFLKLFFCFRTALGVVVLVSASAIIVAFILEYGGWMEPCALCWTQRFMMFTVFLSAFAFWLLNPKSIRIKKFSTGIVSAFCLLGVAVAIRHMYVIINPNVVSCGPNITYVIGMLPWQDLLMTFITGQTACTEASNLLGVPMPIWSLTSFIAFSVLLLIAYFKESKS